MCSKTEEGSLRYRTELQRGLGTTDQREQLYALADQVPRGRGISLRWRTFHTSIQVQRRVPDRFSWGDFRWGTSSAWACLLKRVHLPLNLVLRMVPCSQGIFCLYEHLVDAFKRLEEAETSKWCLSSSVDEQHLSQESELDVWGWQVLIYASVS